jgi:outer membrane protein assembly factor BamB
MSQAHADPWLLHDGRRAALLVDGGTLVGLNPQSGQRDWAVGLADHPLAEPARQVAVVDDVAAAAWKSTLRAVSLRSGDIAWERELPGNVDVWSLASWSGLLAVTGTSRKDACSRHLLLLFRPDGRPVEMLTQPSRSTAADWHIDEQGIALAAADALSVWQPMDDDGEARATRKNHSAAR